MVMLRERAKERERDRQTDREGERENTVVPGTSYPPISWMGEGRILVSLELYKRKSERLAKVSRPSKREKEECVHCQHRTSHFFHYFVLCFIVSNEHLNYLKSRYKQNRHHRLRTAKHSKWNEHRVTTASHTSFQSKRQGRMRNRRGKKKHWQQNGKCVNWTQLVMALPLTLCWANCLFIG